MAKDKCHETGFVWEFYAREIQWFLCITSGREILVEPNTNKVGCYFMHLGENNF